MKLSIIIPTIKPAAELKGQVDAIYKSLKGYKDYEVIIQSAKQSASRNRNAGLYKSKGDYCIMLDDDIEGFFPGWADLLIEPLEIDINIKMVSARLMMPDGKPGVMDDFRKEIDNNKKWYEAPRKKLPAACISLMRNDWLAVKEDQRVPHNLPYDERYQRASYEDVDLCRAIAIVFPTAKFIVNNECKIKHFNLESWRPGFDWTINQKLFQNKWGN